MMRSDKRSKQKEGDGKDEMEMETVMEMEGMKLGVYHFWKQEDTKGSHC